jgi:hypothetical protein
MCARVCVLCRIVQHLESPVASLSASLGIALSNGAELTSTPAGGVSLRNAMAVLACIMIQESAISPVHWQTNASAEIVLEASPDCHLRATSTCKASTPLWGGAGLHYVARAFISQAVSSRAPCRQQLGSRMIIRTPDIQR